MTTPQEREVKMSAEHLQKLSASLPADVHWYNDPITPDIADAIWQAALSQPSIPEGYVLVPIEPTEKMLDAVATKPYFKNPDGWRKHFAKKYKAMLTASKEG